MNLIGDPWIPIMDNNNQSKLVSLKEPYQNACDIKDLAVTPPQRIALMRLLICITQAALDGPEDDNDWLNCQNKIITESINYLHEREDKFNLYGDKPFLQINDLSVDKMAVIDKLDCCLSSGNNATLFDHEANPSGRIQTPAMQALNLLTFMNFSTGGKVGQAVWNKNKFNHSTFAAPCIKSTHTFIRGETLLESIYFNLLTKKTIKKFPNMEWGNPVWDRFPRSPTDNKRFENASGTYLGRLVPISRFINLKYGEKNECIIGPTCKSFKILHLPSFREPSTTIKVNKKGEAYYLPITSVKHIWRELGSLLHLSESMEAGGSPSLQNVQTYYEHLADYHVDIWVGGLEIGAQAAKLNDMVEWNLSIPAGLFGETLMAIYQNGVDLANMGEQALRYSVVTYCAQMGIKEAKSMRSKASINYWTTLDNNYQMLIDLAGNGDELDDWVKLLYGAMNDAYRSACPHKTPRQIQAYAKGKKQLFINIKSS